MAMTYKKRLYFLVTLIAVLILLYSGSIIFNSDLTARRDSFVWLDSKTAEKADKIVVNTSMDQFELFKHGNSWFVLHEDKIFPARHLRVQDFLDLLATRSAWPVRSSSPSNHERFGLLIRDDFDQMAEEGTLFYNQASRVIISADNAVLLDLLIGDDDIYRGEAYFRKFDQNEVRSGNNILKTYANSHAGNWFNLKLFCDDNGGDIDLSSVQRLTVTTPDETQIFTRRNRGWIVSGIEIENPDIPAIENYIRTVLNAEGDGFSDSVSLDDPRFDYSTMVLELGNARHFSVRLTMGDENGRIFAHVNGNNLVYSIPAWSANRLYREAESFQMQ